MKRQINPTIKAHLIRSAFYLLLLVAVCAIPFALAQRNTVKRSSARPKAASESLAAKALPGMHFSTTGRQAARPYNGPTFPYSSVRTQGSATKATVPKLPRTSQAPLRNINTLNMRAVTATPRPRAGQVVLYDQYDNGTAVATGSQQFPDFPTFDDFTADDFVVPGGETWNVQSIDADGQPFNCTGSCVPDNFNVFIYADSGGLPGA